MADGRFVAYYRVSTAAQGQSGLGLDAQRAAVTRYLNGGDWKLIAEVVEVESGKRNDRPKLAEALRLCRIHNSTLVVAKIDRLARNVAFVAALMDAGVKFVAVDMPGVSDLVVHLLASVAQGEAKAISERTKVALAAAKARGTKLGGHRWAVETVAAKGNAASALVRSAKARKRRADLLPVIDDIKARGTITLNGIAHELNCREIHTARGGRWTAQQVKILIGCETPLCP